ncbi:MAG: hypothetical protein ACLFR2_13270 [Candidatus Kapaibacterium sp.]
MSCRMAVSFVIAFLIAACSETNGPLSPQYTSEGKKALVIVVENNDGLLFSQAEFFFQTQYKKELLQIFSDMFEVSEYEMQNMSLNEIIELHGEEWQLNSINNAGTGYYDKIIQLSDANAKRGILLNELTALAKDEYCIDMVFCLHGDNDNFYLSDGAVNVRAFCSDLKKENIQIRSLYQTCCHASISMKGWIDYGIYAVNGAKAVNSITMFSPAYFVESFVSGMSFNDAVYLAFDRELDKISSYDYILPVSAFLLNDQILEDSKQKTGGKDKNIRFINTLP